MLTRPRASQADLIVAALRDPGGLGLLDPLRWESLVSQARSADLLARIAGLVRERSQSVPVQVTAHLDAAEIVTAAQHEEVRREVAHLRRTLAPLHVPVVLLKGSAYVMAQLPAAMGRALTDIDILVPRERLAEVESALLLAGWMTTHHSPYDQRYYREWMHELPPMRHLRRGTVLDVHHAILPETARLRPDSARLLVASRAAGSDERVRVLAPADMVLHCVTHLFHNEEFSHGLRDLSDLDRLLVHWGDSPGFWEQLATRADELHLGRPLHYGLRCAAMILGTPIPRPALHDAMRGAPGRLASRLMDALWSRALRPPHRDADDAWTPAARFFLYLRAHWLRMPPLLLARHLATKAVVRVAQGDEAIP